MTLQVLNKANFSQAVSIELPVSVSARVKVPAATDLPLYAAHSPQLSQKKSKGSVDFQRLSHPQQGQVRPLPRKEGQWVVAHGPGTNNDSRHLAALDRIVQHVNGVSIGEATLKRFSQYEQHFPVFVATTDPKVVPEGWIAKAYFATLDRVVQETPSAQANRGVVYVRTDVAQDALNQTNLEKYRTDFSPATVARATQLAVLEAQTGLDRVKFGQAESPVQKLAEAAYTSAEADRFYAQLTQGGNEGDKYRTLFSRFLIDQNAINHLEEVKKARLSDFRDAAMYQPKWLQLGMETFDSGDGWRSSVLATLQLFDVRQNHLYAKVLSDPRVVNLLAQQAAIQGKSVNPDAAINSLALLYEMNKNLEAGGDAFNDFVQNYLRASPRNVKVSRLQLLERVKSEIEYLVESGKYSKEDVLELIKGLELVDPLRQFFDDLMTRPISPSAPRKRQGPGLIGMEGAGQNQAPAEKSLS